MPSEQEILRNRTFLHLLECERIWADTQRHRNDPAQLRRIEEKKAESDPVLKYHVHSCPRYPSAPPGTGPQAKSIYPALRADRYGAFQSLRIIPKRDQNFASVATQWERTYSVLCGGTGFNPVVNSWMEVTGHVGHVSENNLIRPEQIYFENDSDYFTNEIPIYIWHPSLPPGWGYFTEYKGGLDILVLPNGKVIGAKGYRFASNNGEAKSVISPIDIWTPGVRLAARAIHAVNNRVGGAVMAGYQWLRGPTKELAELSAKRVAAKTLTGIASPTPALPLQHLGRRTVIMGEDMAKMRTALTYSKVQPGVYDVVIHGDDLGFYILVKTIPHPDPRKVKHIWSEVSVREVANVIRPRLASGDQVRLLACGTGGHAGPGQQLANELKNHTVWAPKTSVVNVPGEFVKENGKLVRITNSKSFVPLEGGKFHPYYPQPHRGTATLAGNGGNVPGNVVKGEIRPAVKKK